MAVADSLIELAVKEAHKSLSEFRHGSVSFNRGRVLHKSFNRFLKESDGSNRHSSRHAEIGAVCNLPSKIARGADVLVVRISAAGKLVMSKPCGRCVGILYRWGIRAIHYSLPDGNIACLTLR